MTSRFVFKIMCPVAPIPTEPEASRAVERDKIEFAELFQKRIVLFRENSRIVRI